MVVRGDRVEGGVRHSGLKDGQNMQIAACSGTKAIVNRTLMASWSQVLTGLDIVLDQSAQLPEDLHGSQTYAYLGLASCGAFVWCTRDLAMGVSLCATKMR